MGVGHGLDRFPDAKLLVLQEGNKVKQGVRAFIGAGTGLGVGYAFFNGKTYMVHPCEGGHTSFAPNTELQLNLRRYLVKKYPTTADISVEYLLSGQGIRDIYEYLVNTEQWSENAFLKKQLSLASVEQKARLIVQSALENRSDLLSREVLRCFIQILAAKTADLIFSYFPEEGIFI